MKPREAIKNGLLRSAQFSGRATRSEFWWFAPIALLPIIFTASQIAWDQFDFFGIWRVGLLILVSFPLLSAGYRRIEDVGEEGWQIMLPFMPFVILWVTFQGLYWFSMGTAIFGFGLIIGILALIVLIPAYFFALLTSIFTIGPVVGLLILPSKRNANDHKPARVHQNEQVAN